MAKAIMLQGTASNVGKSVLATGLCRVFADDGFRVAPFKAQNISHISFTTGEGDVISRAQAVQAWAARKEPERRMNPILLCPHPGYSSQIVLRGKRLWDVTPGEFYGMRGELLRQIAEDYRSLAAENDIVVIEGAGCSAEINLTASDLVNMTMARIASAPVLLVGDIDRGGVFAALYGTYMLQPEADKRYIKGTIINKFRGDPAILEPAPHMLEQLLDIPNVGVVPYLPLRVEAEDVLSAQEEADSGNDFDGLAAELRRWLDIKKIYEILEDGV